MKKYLLHTEVWMTENHKTVAKGLQKKLNVATFSQHLFDHLSNKDHKHDYTRQDIENVVKRIVNNPIDPFELEVTENDWGIYHITKYCVRTILNKDYDISIVVGSKNNIVTAWINEESDTHNTLDIHKYYDPRRKNNEGIYYC